MCSIIWSYTWYSYWAKVFQFYIASLPKWHSNLKSFEHLCSTNWTIWLLMKWVWLSHYVLDQEITKPTNHHHIYFPTSDLTQYLDFGYYIHQAWQWKLIMKVYWHLVIYIIFILSKGFLVLNRKFAPKRFKHKYLYICMMYIYIIFGQLYNLTTPTVFDVYECEFGHSKDEF